MISFIATSRQSSFLNLNPSKLILVFHKSNSFHTDEEYIVVFRIFRKLLFGNINFYFHFSINFDF